MMRVKCKKVLKWGNEQVETGPVRNKDKKVGDKDTK
jgi:hypothetical protein